ncbi:MAG: malate synthase G, partial [Pusillimonas sp.]|nr:malate synthase G [Pusillimonas sp.]
MTQRTQCEQLQVANLLHQFIEQEALPGTNISSDDFWKGFNAIVHDLAPRNRALLAERDRIQAGIDAWYRKNPGPIKDMPAYKAFLK